MRANLFFRFFYIYIFEYIYVFVRQSTADRHYIVHLAPTPVPDEGDLSSEDEEALPNARVEQAKSKFPDSIPKVVDATVSEHTRQVRSECTAQSWYNVVISLVIIMV